MARDQELNRVRNEELLAAFEAMRGRRNKYGELVMHPENIIGRLGRKYHLSKRRVEDIVYKRSWC